MRRAHWLNCLYSAAAAAAVILLLLLGIDSNVAGEATPPPDDKSVAVMFGDFGFGEPLLFPVTAVAAPDEDGVC